MANFVAHRVMRREMFGDREAKLAKLAPELADFLAHAWRLYDFCDHFGKDHEEVHVEQRVNWFLKYAELKNYNRFRDLATDAVSLVRINEPNRKDWEKLILDVEKTCLEMLGHYTPKQPLDDHFLGCAYGAVARLLWAGSGFKRTPDDAGAGGKAKSDGVAAKGLAPPKGAKKQSGQGRKWDTAIKGYLIRHHNYPDDLNQTPATVRGIASKLGAPQSSVSNFFRRQYRFRGHEGYVKQCRDVATLRAALLIINNEMTPGMLSGRGSVDRCGRRDDGD